MKEIFIDINDYNKSFITATENDNNSDIYKIIITEDGRRFDLTGKTVQMAYAISYTDKGDILNLNVTNPTQGEITLEITNELTRKDGDYTCQLLILGENEYRRHSKYYFNLSIRENLFNKISGEIIESPSIGILQELVKKAEILNTQLENNNNVAEGLNNNLSENINLAEPLNSSLGEKIPEAAIKKTELESSIVKAKEFIDGLDGSQNIPGIRMELTELQNGLKSNQALEYQGSSISAENTLEGRTEGMKIGGRTLKNFFILPNKEYTTTSNRYYLLGKDNFKTSTKYMLICDVKDSEEINVIDRTTYLRVDSYEGNVLGGYLGVVGTHFMRVYFEFTTPSEFNGNLLLRQRMAIGTQQIIKNIVILEYDEKYKNINYFEGLKSFGEAEQEGDKYKISILSSSLSKIKFEQGTIDSSHGNDVYVNNRIKSDFIEGNFESIKNTNLDFNKFMILLYTYDSSKRFIKTTTPEWVNYIDIDNIPSNTKYMRILIKYKDDSNIGIDISKSIYFGINDKKDILISAPLPGFDFGEDIIYEENGQVKITRNIDNYIFTGDETMRDTTEQDEKSGTGKYKVFVLTINKTIDKNKNINNNFPKKQFSVAFQKVDSEGLAITQYGVYIKILKSKLSTQDAEGLKAWLKANQTVIYFVRAIPVTEILENCVDIDLDTFQDKTYFNILNSLPGTLDFKVPSNIGSVVQNMAKEVNEIWDVINNLLVPGLMDTKKTLALKTIKNNLK